MSNMSVTYIKGSELPPYLIEKLKIDPSGFFKLTVEPQYNKANDMEKAFGILDNIHNKMKDEDFENIENLINEAVKSTRNYA